ncbi:MAG: type II secretory pathway pseudopilin PulG [Flavobacterium sp.]|jgi:type II secretory pathway pseudopilin PulG
MFRRRLHPSLQRGFTLLEVSILLGLVAGLTVLLIQPGDTKEKIVRSDSQLKSADQQLVTFMAANGRLPCVDINADGREDCTGGSAKGIYLISLSV